MIPTDLLTQAQHLLGLSPKRPKQANLRRAVSACYYAVFHALCRSNANILAGTGPNKSNSAWVQAYRASDHGLAKSRCKDTKNKNFPLEINAFADAFVTLQEQRHRADYSPDRHFTKNEVEQMVVLARGAVKAIDASTAKDRRAFSIHILLPYRP